MVIQCSFFPGVDWEGREMQEVVKKNLGSMEGFLFTFFCCLIILFIF